jgi:Uma2 family endonuclease
MGMAFSTSERTVGNLPEHFGLIPVTRIRLDPIPGSATEQDVIDIEARENRLYELVDGVLVEKVMGFYESYLAMLLGRFLTEFVQQRNLGVVTGEAGMLKLAADQIRIPDVSFVSWARLGSREIPREPIPQLCPDLAVEVISQGNTPEEMDRKLREYFHAGVRLVWYVYPDRRVVRVFTAADQVVEVREAETLDGGNVLPGFSLPLPVLFAPPPALNP